jgi:hypothetical protein
MKPQTQSHTTTSVKPPKAPKGTPLTPNEAMKIRGLLDKNRMTLGADWSVYHAPYLGGFGDPIPNSEAIMHKWRDGKLTAAQVIDRLKR